MAPTLKRRLELGMIFWNVFGIEPAINQDGYVVEVIGTELEEESGLTEKEKMMLEDMKSELRVFEKGDKLDVIPQICHKIEFEDQLKNGGPIRLNPYSWSPEIQMSLNGELNKWFSSEIVERSNSDWASLIVPVTKKGE